MIDKPKPQDEPAAVKKDWQIAVKWLNTSGLRILIIVALVLTIALIVFAVFGVNDPDTRANVLTVGILTILTIIVTTVSAVSNRLMVEIMDRQESEVTEQRITMQKQLTAMKDTLEQGRELFDLVERPIVIVSKVNASDFVGSRTLCPTFVVENKGRMGAKELTLVFGIKTGQHSIYPKIDGYVELPFLAAGDKAKLTISEGRVRHFNPENFASIMENEILFVWGKGAYFDMSRQKKYIITPFVFRFDPKSGEFIADHGLPQLWHHAQDILREEGQLPEVW